MIHQAATTSALKKNDLVVVISGRDKGKKGKIQKFLLRDKAKAK